MYLVDWDHEVSHVEEVENEIEIGIDVGGLVVNGKVRESRIDRNRILTGKKSSRSMDSGTGCGVVRQI